MMSEKSSKSVRSKIPRFQGTRKKVLMTKTEALNPKTAALNQRAKELEKPDCLKLQNIKVSDTNKSDKHIDVGDVPFELDNAALSSILTNKGIVPRIALRESEMPIRSSVCKQIPGGHLSLRESLDGFKEQLKLYRKFQEYENSRKAEANPLSQTGILNNKSTAVTPRTTKISPAYHQPKRPLTLTESLEEHKKNIRIFREKMQSYDNALLTPRTPGSQVFSEFTPRQRQMANNMRMFSSTASRNNGREVWTGSKENISPKERRRPTAFSTSKKTSVRFDVSQEPSSLFLTANKEKLYSAKAVKRPLLPSLIESEENEKTINTGSSEQMLKESCNSVDSKESVIAYSSARNHLELNTVHKKQAIIPGLPTSVFSSPLVMSPDILKSTNLAMTPVTASSQLCPKNAVNSSQYSWTCQEASSTPLQSQHKFEGDVSTQEPTNCKTPTTCKLVFEPDWIKSYNTCTKVAKGTNGYVDFNEANQINRLTTSAQPLPGDLSDCFSKLDLASQPRLLVTSHTGSSTLQNQFTPVSQLHQQKSTPTTQAQRALRTPTTPFLSRPPMRVQKSSSRLKCKEDSSSHSPNCLPLRFAETSAVKKLRWVDIQNQ